MFRNRFYHTEKMVLESHVKKIKTKDKNLLLKIEEALIYGNWRTFR